MSMSIGSFLGCLFGDRHYTRKGRSMLFFCRFPLKSRFLEGLDTKKQVVFDTTINFKEDYFMKMSIGEKKILFVFGCPNREATVNRLYQVVEMIPDLAEKKVVEVLADKLDGEGV